MDDPWVNSAGEIVHPDSPRGAGGPGSFRGAHPLGTTLDARSKLPHPHAPAARYLPHTEVKKKHKPKPAVAVAKPASADDLRADVKARADKLVGKKVVGDGECFALADTILKEAGGSSADRYGKITASADYAWGREISDIKDVQPGDVLQFRDHEITIETVTTTKTTSPDGAWDENTDHKIETHKRGHHTAIVSSKNADGTLTVVEQHVKDPSTGTLSHVVRQNRLIISDSSEQRPTVTSMRGKVKVEQQVTITITVTGTIKVYRPELQP